MNSRCGRSNDYDVVVRGFVSLFVIVSSGICILTRINLEYFKPGDPLRAVFFPCGTLHRRNAWASALLFILFVTSLSSHGQSTLPESYLNTGIGIGMNYGGFGVKTVIGRRNSGLLIGLGGVPGVGLGYEVGAQLGVKSFYVNCGYGIAGTHQINDRPAKPIKCMSVVLGGMINLNKSKDVFLDLGLGHTAGAPTVTYGPFEENLNSFIVVLGIGMRLVRQE